MKFKAVLYLINLKIKTLNLRQILQNWANLATSLGLMVTIFIFLQNDKDSKVDKIISRQKDSTQLQFLKQQISDNYDYYNRQIEVLKEQSAINQGNLKLIANQIHLANREVVVLERQSQISEINLVAKKREGFIQIRHALKSMNKLWPKYGLDTNRLYTDFTPAKRLELVNNIEPLISTQLANVALLSNDVLARVWYSTFEMTRSYQERFYTNYIGLSENEMKRIENIKFFSFMERWFRFLMIVESIIDIESKDLDVGVYSEKKDTIYGYYIDVLWNEIEKNPNMELDKLIMKIQKEKKYW